MRQPGGRSVALATAVAVATVAAAACAPGRDGLLDPSPCLPPAVSGATVTPSASNVLSALARAEVRRADSVVVRFGVLAALDSATPAFPVRGDSVVAPVL